MSKKDYKCSWPDCDSLFTRKENLRRHISTVHKKERRHVCNQSKCGATFSSAYHLKRHFYSVHAKERNYKCDFCGKAFNTRGVLIVHERTIHGIKIETPDNSIRFEKPSYECAECGHTFVQKYTLARHIHSRHFEKEHFECDTCGFRYYCRKYLEKHIFTKHCDQVNHTPSKNSYLRCLMCKKYFHFMYQIENHYQEFHQVDLKIEKLKFPSMQDFYNWKSSVEDATKSRFRLRSKTKCKYGFVCHRSGPICVKLFDRKRANIVRGSKKLDGVCPASMKLVLNEKYSSCTVTFIQTHVGHLSNDNSELKYCFPRRRSRKLVRQFNAPTDLMYDFVNVKVERNGPSANADMCDVEKSHGNFSLAHEKDDVKNVEEFVTKYEKCVLLYKRRDQKIQNEYEGIDVKDEDTILIFMCPSQRKILEKHWNIVCLDGNDEINKYGLSLLTLLVLDYDGEGFPVAFVISNRTDDVLIEVFSRCLKMHVGVIIPDVMITDIQDCYLNGWRKEMGSPDVILHCMWYLWQTWRKHLPKPNKNVQNDEKNILRANLERDLYSLSVESCVETFHQKLNNFLTPCNDAEINSFLEYFRREYCGDEKYLHWAYSYRSNVGLNTNTHLESFHSTLKYVHEYGRSIKDLFSGLQSIRQYVIRKINSMLNKTIHAQLTPQLIALRRAHKEFQEFQNKQKIIVLEVSPEEWRVQSFKETKDLCVEMYIIRKIRHTCPVEEDRDVGACYRMCNECGDCAHKYSCSCIESAIQFHMCKHIHTVLSYDNIEIVHNFESLLISNTMQPVIVDVNLIPAQSEEDEHSPILMESTQREITDEYEKVNYISRKKIKERLRILAESIDHRSEEEILIIKEHLDHLEHDVFGFKKNQIY